MSSRRRVLLVTSGLPPTMLADAHRGRMLCYDLPRWGWDIEVLSPSSQFRSGASIEPRSEALRSQAPIHEAAPEATWVFDLLRSRSLGWRSLLSMYRHGKRVLRSRKFDLVYISTTNFPLFCLGRLWLRTTGVPYVLDIHDPWHRQTTKYATTRHRFKAAVSRWLSGPLERWALKSASGLVSVSPDYVDNLSARYPQYVCVRRDRSVVIPFAAAQVDISAARSLANRGPASDGLLHIVYTGAGSSIMAKSFARICSALQSFRREDPDKAGRLRIRLIGTDSGWQEGSPRTLQEIAERFGVGDLVDETPKRVEYLEALRAALEADGLLILGVDDPAYMPSKLFTYALTGKPILACLHADSRSGEYFGAIPGLGYLMRFDDNGSHSDGDALRQFLRDVAEHRTIDRSAAIAQYLSPAAARRHAEFFDACISPLEKQAA
jgi:glycosyltransferase involved in cell wall biosynthesis